MNIGIDLDGTITDFHRYLIKFGKIFLKKNNITFKIKNQNKFEVEDIFDLNDADLKYFKEYIRIYLRMKVKPRKYAVEFMNELHIRGFNIYIITSRKDIDQIDSIINTKKWLAENNIYYDYLIIGNSNKLEECKKNNIQIFIDDKIKHVQFMREAGIKSFLFDNVYNRKHDFERVKSFNNLIKTIEFKLDK